MSKIGKLWTEGEGDDPVLRGEITTLNYYLDFRLMPVIDRGHDKAPTHDLVMKGTHGKYANIGVAWRQEIKKGNSVGLDMYSIQITDPSLPAMRCAAFPVANSGTWSIETERPRQAGETVSEDGVVAEAAAA